MRAMITGGAGFIGLHLARALVAQGWSVDLVDDFSRGARDGELDALAATKGVRVLSANLCEAQGWAGLADDYDHIYHMAAIVGVANVLNNAFGVLDRNVAMTVLALNHAARQKALSRFVFASTSEVYAGTLQHYGLPFPTPETVPLTIPDVAHPRTSYMLSKIYGESLCLQSGLPVTIVRPHNVYGPRMGMSHVVPELMKKVWSAPAGSELEVFSVDHQRTFCYVEDAVTLITRAAAAPEGKGTTVNIGTQEPEVTMGQLAVAVMAAVGKELPVKAMPVHPGSPPRRCPDVALVDRITGHGTRVPLSEGLSRTFAWYRDNVFTKG
jgi:nucleoside-diphosphate-sugar epimerase